MVGMVGVLLITNVASASSHTLAASSFYVTLDWAHSPGAQILTADLDHPLPDPTHASFTIGNGTQLWYGIHVTKSSPDITLTVVDPARDTIGAQFVLANLLPPTNALPLTADGSYTFQNTGLAANFTGPNETVALDLDPFTTDAATMDILNLIYQIGGAKEDAFKGLVGPEGTKQIFGIAKKLKNFTNLINDFVAMLHSLKSPGELAGHAKDFAQDLLDIYGDGAERANLAKMVWLSQGGSIPLDKVLDNLASLNVWFKVIQFGVAVGGFVKDLAFAIGSILVTQFDATILLQSRPLTTAKPTPGPQPTPGAAGTPPPSNPGPGNTPAPTPQSSMDNSAWEENSAPINAQPGQSIPMYFKLRNTGNTTWGDGSGFALACDTYYHPSNNDCMGGGTVGFGGNTVAPGSDYVFAFTLTAPSSPGTYQTWWDMRHNGGIFGANNNYVQVVVSAPQHNPTWQTWFSQHRPFCDDGNPWNGDVNHSATDDCSNANGLILSKYQNSSAELDLNHPNGNGNYPMTQFRVTVQGNFLNPSDTSVKAGLLVQTPQNANQYGGYILAIASNGYWELQLVNTGNGSKNVQNNGTIGGFNPGNFTLQVTVDGGTITSIINGQQVDQRGDGLNPSPGALGLMEEGPKPTSSAILFHDFVLELKQ
ncbi:MAG: hypothetical protein H0X24_01035 [Ktedonobacterales bacterium]|nr:hypothetical protein [Ktedonobacterales bacterium]